MAATTRKNGSEDHEVMYCDSGGVPRYEMCSVHARDEFLLYRVDGADRTLIGKDPNPLALETKYGVMDKLRKISADKGSGTQG